MSPALTWRSRSKVADDAQFSFVDDEDVARSTQRMTLSCPACGGSEVVAAMDSLFHEQKDCPLGTDGPWFAIPMLCADEDCGSIFGVVFAQDGVTSVMGYSIPEIADEAKELFA